MISKAVLGVQLGRGGGAGKVGEGGDKEMYLAVDRSCGLFVIGIFAEKEPAWEACNLRNIVTSWLIGLSLKRRSNGLSPASRRPEVQNQTTTTTTGLHP